MSYIDTGSIPPAQNGYVLWVDIMGTKNKVYSSVMTASIFMLKLHAAVLQNLTDDLIAYPIMDGAYITSINRSSIQRFITKLFATIGKDIIKQTDTKHCFLIKAALAFGPLINGKDISVRINRTFQNRDQYKNSILIGLPMIQAYSSESLAPPFGVFIHESARAFAPEGEMPFEHKWWKWFIRDRRVWTQEQNNKLQNTLKRYFQEAENQSIVEDYSMDRITFHKKMFAEYFYNPNTAE